MRTCGGCGKAQVKKYGESKIHGHFRDQIIFCPKCDWVGVETEYVNKRKRARDSSLAALTQNDKRKTQNET